MKDNQEIFRYNGGYYTSDGESIIRNIVQQALGIRCIDKYKTEVVGWVKDCANIQVDRDIFDMSANKINLENGTFDIESESFEEHNPGHFFNYKLPVVYDKKANMPNIKKFLETTLPLDDIKLIQEMVGYCIYRKYHIHKGFIEVGNGRNGKSTLNELITTFLGEDNVSHVPLQKLCKDKFDTWRLYGKLANICNDLPSYAIEYTGGFKQLCGGDHIYADRKHKEGFSFVNTAKMIFACNTIPEIKDKSKAMAERLIAVEFTNTFDSDNPKTDNNLLPKLTTDKELGGFLNFGLEGLHRLQTEGKFSSYRSLDELSEYLAEHQNPVRQFIDAYIVSSETGELLKGEVYSKFLEYCKQNGIPTIASNQFTQRFKRYAPFKISEGQSRLLKGKTWKGVNWKNQQESIFIEK